MNPFARPAGIKRGRISALSRQIIFINFVALAILVVGVLFIQTRRAGLVDERVGGIRQEALTVASALAEYATQEDRLSIDDAKAELSAAQEDRASLEDQARAAGIPPSWIMP